MKFGEEVERIIQLQVTVATVNVSIIVALHKVRNRVDVGIVHETDTVAATLAVRLGVLIEPVEKHGVSGIAAYDRDIAVDRLGRGYTKSPHKLCFLHRNGCVRNNLSH